MSSTSPSRHRGSNAGAHLGQGVAAAAAAAAAAPRRENEFFKHISIDFSGLERKFTEVIARLEIVEARMERNTTMQHHALPHAIRPEGESPNRNRIHVGADSAPPPMLHTTFEGLRESVAMDMAEVVKELESVRAAQLRFKIDQELAQSTFKVELEGAKRDLSRMPQQSDLGNFRAEVNVIISAAMKDLAEQHASLTHNVNVTLSERELMENKWKSVFEETMNHRIQDVWNGLQTASKKMVDNIQFIQTDMIKQEESMKEMMDFVDQIKRRMAVMENEGVEQDKQIMSNKSEVAVLRDLVTNLMVRLDAHENNTTSNINGLTQRIDATDSRLQIAQSAHETFATDTDRTLRAFKSDLAYCQSSLIAHQETLHSLDAGITRHSADIVRINDQLAKHEGRIGGIDGRVTSCEKKLTTVATVIQDHQDELQNHVRDIKEALEYASQDRVSMKRATTENSFSIQEIQQTMSEVGKMSAATELALARTASEIPKLHVLVSTNANSVTKVTEMLYELQQTFDDEKAFAHSVDDKLAEEKESTIKRFAEVAKRDDENLHAIHDTNSTIHNMRHALEESIRYNSSMIHQLNTMVDSLAITESSEGMEDKLAKFALSCAELGLKMEHFSKNTPGMTSLKGDIKGELAVLLAKIIRFLGSGVSIDQNKYLLAAKRTQYVDPSTGAIIVETPPQHVLESFRLAKATLFSTKMRASMDQLHPVAATAKHITEFRDAFERKVMFVIEYGLANLFPNTGRGRGPNGKRDNTVGTCIACDRPIEDDTPEAGREAAGNGAGGRSGSIGGGGPEQDNGPPSMSFDELVAEEQRLRRNKIVSGVGSALLSTRIDQKTAVKGRSGNSTLRPKSSADPIHHAPGTGEFVYRGGFRLPKQQLDKQQSANSQMRSSSSAAALAAAAMGGAGIFEPNGSVSSNVDAPTMLMMDDGSSCLEKVPLMGRCQVDIPGPLMTGTSSSSSSSPSPGVRPHTAPYRAKSLPRLEALEQPT